MGLKAQSQIIAESAKGAAENAPAQTVPAKSYTENKDAKILYQGLTQAALQSMGLTQWPFESRKEYLAAVKEAVDELAAFVLERAS
jgi:hypothetical protein